MHLPDGFIAPGLSLPAFAVAVPLWTLALRRHFGPAAVEYLPAVGSLTAMSFVLQTVLVPTPAGTSVHLVGVTLLALLFHPLVAFVAESLVLLLQALFLGAGGITVLGLNALAMGLLGPLAGWLAWRALRSLSARAAAFVAGWLSTQVATLSLAAVLALQHHLEPTYLPVPPTVGLAALMLPSLTFAGVCEGLYTVLALSLVRRVRLQRGADGME